MFANSLYVLVFLLAVVVIFGFINERTIKIADEIALMLFSFIAGVVIMFIFRLTDQMDLSVGASSHLLNYIEGFNFEGFLMHGILCFMLFSGATEIHIRDMKKYLKLTTYLSLLTTLLGTVIYGGLFYLIVTALNFKLSFTICLLLGCVVAPTDPIAATSILKRFNLPHDTSIVIQGESLFNDGVGAALVVCVLSSITNTGAGESFVSVMCKELFGAMAVGIAISFVLYYLFKVTDDRFRKITISLLAVSSCYILCDYLGFSGPIASVVCGIYFSSKIDHDERHHDLDLPRYNYFWEVLDNLLNSILYVMIGLAFPAVIHMPNMLLFAVIAIVINTVSRALSVGVSSKICKDLPDKYHLTNFTALLTWGGLKGGLCLALALSLKEFLDIDVYYVILGCTYSIVFFTTIIQGLSMSKVYNLIKPKDSH